MLPRVLRVLSLVKLNVAHIAAFLLGLRPVSFSLHLRHHREVDPKAILHLCTHLFLHIFGALPGISAAQLVSLVSFLWRHAIFLLEIQIERDSGELISEVGELLANGEHVPVLDNLGSGLLGTHFGMMLGVLLPLPLLESLIITLQGLLLGETSI